MIYIEKNTVNKVALELLNLIDYDTPNFLFEFYHLNTNSYIYFTTDTFTDLKRCQIFDIEDSETGIEPVQDAYVTGTEFNFTGGQYRYNVYASNSTFTSIIIADVWDYKQQLQQNSEPDPYIPISTGKMFVEDDLNIIQLNNNIDSNIYL